MKKLIAGLLGIAVMTLFVVGCGEEKKQQVPKPVTQKFINIASGGTSGTYFPLGAATAEILNKSMPNTNASNQSTGASVANINLLKQSKVEIAFVQNDIAYYAANGLEMFAGKKVAKLQGIATLYPETVQIIALKDSSVKSVRDCVSKRVAVGAAGSGVEANARQILNAHGLRYDDCRVYYMNFGEAVGALMEKSIDVAFITAGYPTAAVQELSAKKDIMLVGIEDSVADALVKEYPFYTKVTIPKGTYNLAEDTKALAVKCMLATTDRIDEKQGYDITKAIYSNLDRLKEAHKVANDISKVTAKDGMSIKLHPGAEKFLNEK